MIRSKEWLAEIKDEVVDPDSRAAADVDHSDALVPRFLAVSITERGAPVNRHLVRSTKGEGPGDCRFKELEMPLRELSVKLLEPATDHLFASEGPAHWALAWEDVHRIVGPRAEEGIEVAPVPRFEQLPDLPLCNQRSNHRGLGFGSA